MRSAFVVSLLVHVAAFAFVIEASSRRQDPARPALAFELPSSEAAATPDEPPREPAMEEPESVSEPVELERPPPVEFGEWAGSAVPLASVPAPMRAIRLPRPLRVRQVDAPKPANKPVPSAPREVAQPARPRPDGCPAPRYPSLARRMGFEGVVRLRLQIDAHGDVTDVALHASSGHRILDRAAVRAARSWRFLPAREGARTIAGEIVQTVEFRLR